MAPFALTVAGLLLLTPPAGRPPEGPLERVEPRAYDVSFDVTVGTAQQQYAPHRRTYEFEDAVIGMPIIFQSSYSRVAPDSLAARLWLAGREDSTLRQRTRLDEGFPHHTHLAVLPIPRFHGYDLRWRIEFSCKVWSSRLDETGAANLTWPKTWPEEIRDGLKAERFIESDDPIFAATVERVSQGQLRLVPPYLAAKDLIRYSINNLQVVGDGLNYGEFGELQGLEMAGAKAAAGSGRGSSHDLVCVCVAMLRAAGIPARPVIGIMEQRDDPKQRNTLVTWAEFYLVGAGWIPFDPEQMRGKGIRTLDVRRPWPELGTIDELNRRIPLTYTFLPRGLQVPQNPAVWGWEPRPGGDPSSQQQLRIGIVSRGRAPEEPR